LYAKAGATEKREIILKAYELANEVAEYANNMMTAGRISGFAVKSLPRPNLLSNCSCIKLYHIKNYVLSLMIFTTIPTIFFTIS